MQCRKSLVSLVKADSQTERAGVGTGGWVDWCSCAVSTVYFMLFTVRCPLSAVLRVFVTKRETLEIERVGFFLSVCASVIQYEHIIRNGQREDGGPWWRAYIVKLTVDTTST